MMDDGLVLDATVANGVVVVVAAADAAVADSTAQFERFERRRSGASDA